MTTPYIWLFGVNVDTYDSGFGLIYEVDDDGSYNVAWWVRGAHNNFDAIDHKEEYDDDDECDCNNKSCNSISQYLATKGGRLIGHLRLQRFLVLQLFFPQIIIENRN